MAPQLEAWTIGRLGALLLAFAATACADLSPRVVEVTATRRVSVIAQADEPLFLRDRATEFSFDSPPLPANQQGEEFLVRWVPAYADEVRLQFRQVHSPNQINELSQPARGLRRTIFRVMGDDFYAGGPVSAWRVTLWLDGELLAEKQSVLW